MSLDTKSLTAAQKDLAAGLNDLNQYATTEDILQTATLIGRSAETVRRYLRLDIRDWETAKQIHDDLRERTVARSHMIIGALSN